MQNFVRYMDTLTENDMETGLLQGFMGIIANTVILQALVNDGIGSLEWSQMILVVYQAM